MTWILLTNTTQLSTQHHAYKRVYTNYIYKPYIPHGSSPNITHTNITQLFTQDIQISLNSSPRTYKHHSTLHPGHTNITQLFTQDISGSDAFCPCARAQQQHLDDALSLRLAQRPHLHQPCLHGRRRHQPVLRGLIRQRNEDARCHVFTSCQLHVSYMCN